MALHPDSTENVVQPTVAYLMPMAPSAVDDEIDLRELLSTLYAHRKVIVAITVLFVILAGVYAFSTPKRFRADTLVAPYDSNQGNGGGLSQIAGSLGGLASLAGVSLSGGGDKDVSIATLQSRDLVLSLIKDENLLPILFADQWNESKKAWDVSDPRDVPTLLDGYVLFQKRILKVSEDKKTGLVTLEIEWTDPQLAAHWANEMVRRANAELQKKAVDDSDRHIAYLENQIQQTSLVDMRQSIYSLLENELKTAMVAKGNDQYAFKVIDPAVVPEKKIWPKRALILVLGFMAGLFFAIVGVLAHHSWVNGASNRS
ncbi:MAG: hypothetical protein E6R07_09305 [Nevskiaceae bacterium]|nr:MAG: hypothetical protein E6R07_09305 [Nevskiaceae bacterium]